MGSGECRGAVLYPTLPGLETDGLVAFHWEDGPNGPARKMYHITSDGLRALDENQRTWTIYAQRIELLFRETRHE